MIDAQTRIIRYSTINFIGWIASIGITLLSIPFFLSKISTDEYGAWVLIGSFTGYFSLLQFGIGPAVIKFIAQFKAQNDQDEINDIINSALIFSTFVGIIGGVVLYIFSPYIVSVFHIPDHLYNQTLLSFKIGAIFFPALLVSSIYVSVFIGFQNYLLSNLLNTIQIGLSAFIGIIFLEFGFGIIGLVVSSAIVDILCIGIGHYLVYKTIECYELKFSGAFSMLRRMFGYSMYTFISQLSQLFNMHLAEIIIGIVLGPSAVTFFNIPSRLIGFFSSGASSLSAVLFPFASELQTKSNVHQIRRVFLTTTRYFSFLIVPFYFFVIVYSKFILTSWLSPKIAEESHALMVLCSLAYLISNMTNIPSQFLQGFGKVKLISRFSVGVLVVSLIAYYPLTRQMGIVGAGVALLVTQVLGVIFIYYALNILNVSVREYLSSNGKPFLLGLIALILPMLFSYLTRGYMSSYLLSTFTAFTLFSTSYIYLCISFSEIGTLAKKYYHSFSWR